MLISMKHLSFFLTQSLKNHVASAAKPQVTELGLESRAQLSQAQSPKSLVIKIFKNKAFETKILQGGWQANHKKHYIELHKFTDPNIRVMNSVLLNSTAFFVLDSNFSTWLFMLTGPHVYMVGHSVGKI